MTTETTRKLSHRVQEMSIHWLSLPKTERITKLTFGADGYGGVINKIIELYNKKIASKRDDEAQSDTSHFVELTGFHFKNPCGYQWKFYTRRVITTPTISRELQRKGVDSHQLDDKVSNQFVLFFFRKEPDTELVALTTGSAWQAVSDYVEYAAPIRVAERVLDPDHMVEMTRRGLLGTDASETVLCHNGQDNFKLVSLFYYVEMMKCQIKEIPDLKQILRKLTDMTYRPKSIRPNRRLNLSKYPQLLDFLSPIAKGTSEEYPPDMRFEFLHFLEAEHELTRTLDNALAKQIWTIFSKGEVQRVSFRHSYLRDFLEADRYLIQVAPQYEYEEINRPITLPAILEYLRRALPHLFETADALTQGLQAARFKFFTKNGVEMSSHSLLDLMEGEVRSDRDHSYFKLRGVWFKVAVDHHALLQDDFRALLKQTVLRRDEPGHLPLPWKGNSQEGQLTSELLKEILGPSEDVEAGLAILQKTKVSFVDGEGNVLHKILIGEILDDPLVKREKEPVEALLSSKPQLTVADFSWLAPDEAKALMTLLQTQRHLMHKKHVINPLTYGFPLLHDLLSSCHKIYLEKVETEEMYNRKYLRRPDCLVFDQVIPHNIEMFDIAHWHDRTTYLYHVKESFGQSTRDACSQISNGASILRSALSTHGSENHLRLMWNEGIKGGSPWREDLKRNLVRLGEEPFLRLFQDNRIVFVYAFLEKSTTSIQQEMTKKTFFTPDDFIHSGIRDSKAIYDKLQNLGYLDPKGRLTGKFYNRSKGANPLGLGSLEFDAIIWQILEPNLSFSKSTLAKFELLKVARDVRLLGFDFKVCEIARPQGTNSPSSIEDSDIDFIEDSQSVTSLPPQRGKRKASTPINRESSQFFQRIMATPYPKFPNNQSPDTAMICYVNTFLQMILNTSSLVEVVKQIDPNKTGTLDEILSWIVHEPTPPPEGPVLLRKALIAQAGWPNDVSHLQDCAELFQHFSAVTSFLLCNLTFHRRGSPDKVSQTPCPQIHIDLPLTTNEKISLEELIANKFKWQRHTGAVMHIGGRFFREWDETYALPSPLPQHLLFRVERSRPDGTKNSAQIIMPDHHEIKINDVPYRCTSIISHEGPVLNEGHFITYNRHPSKGWYKCNDQRITPVPDEFYAGIGNDGYLFLFEQIEESTQATVPETIDLAFSSQE